MACVDCEKRRRKFRDLIFQGKLKAAGVHVVESVGVMLGKETEDGELAGDRSGRLGKGDQSEVASGVSEQRPGTSRGNDKDASKRR